MVKEYGRAAVLFAAPLSLILVGWAIDSVFVAAQSYSLPEVAWWVVLSLLVAIGLTLFLFMIWKQVLFLSDLFTFYGETLSTLLMLVAFWPMLGSVIFAAPQLALSSFQSDCPQSIQYVSEDASLGEVYTAPLLSLVKDSNGVAFMDAATGDRIHLSRYHQNGKNFFACVRDRFR